MENPQDERRIRYGVFTYLCDDLYSEIVALLEREEELLGEMVDTWKDDGSDIVRILTDLDAIWTKLSPRQAALSRVRDMASRETTPMDRTA
jgi:hypothetical protein